MIDKIIEISKEAGGVIRDGFGKNVNIEFKTNETNLVTEIDKKSEDIIIDFIKREFPEHGILAEESGAHEEASEYLWVVDPLDGTTNFAHGLPIFSVSIGVVKNGNIVAGVIYDVMQDLVYAAEKGGGAYCNNQKIQVNKTAKLIRSLLVTGFPYDVLDNPDSTIEKFGAMLKQSRAVRRLGSAAIDLCYVAKGVFEGFWEVHLHPWDMCAGMLLVEEAGGRISNYNDQPIDIYSKQLLATNGVIHDDMVNILKGNV